MGSSAMSRIVPAVLAAALVVLAGCAGGIGGPSDTEASNSGTVAFYVSDERNAIDQFSHLNVTVTEVAFAGDANASAEAEAGLVTRDVEDRTVGLTTLQGANATLLGNVSVPEGEYETVFVRVSGVNGTLENGESVNVKLPSQKLRVNESVEADGSASVDFVFDITVVEAGNSGTFVLKPVASESGTDVEIEAVGAAGAAANAELDVSVLGNASAGENATVKVTQQGEAVANAELHADDEVVATTNVNGTAEVSVPADGELELEATANASGGAASDERDAIIEGELDLELGGGDSAADGDAEQGTGDDNATSGDENSGDSDGTSGEDDGTSDGSASADLAVALDGSLTADEQATVVATDGDGGVVENATVAVDGAVVGETNADGELTFDVPADAGIDSELTVTADGESVTLQAGTVAAAN